MKIVINNQQKVFCISTLRLRWLVAWLLQRSVGGSSGSRARGLETPPTKQLSNMRWQEVGILLTDDAGIVMANEAVFGRDYVTDVISLTYLPQPGEVGLSGELIINVELAVREGARRAGGPDRELALYLAHGCDHLAGADDATPRQRAAMRRRELRWLRLAAREGLLKGLFPRVGKRKR
ncbi:MAG: rRNA maturation RNase YbeY [Verrucomicrobia bacterium]|nr:MAG: rRNA maturation RNase YbeY [Verrucomicrobiota bacterium]